MLDPIDTLIFTDWTRIRERHAMDHRAYAQGTMLHTGGRHAPTERELRGHPTRADEHLRRF